MATTFVIACPKCSKQVKVTEEHVGKKVRCKGCGEVYPIQAPSGGPPPVKKSAPPSPPPVPEPPKKPIDDDDEGGPMHYEVIFDEGALPRCPFCAMELESHDARVCLHCGYDTVKRLRPQVKQVYAHTVFDLLLWWSPAILGILFVAGMITWYAFFWKLIVGWLEDSWFEDEKGPPATYIAAASPGMFRLYHGIFVIYLTYIIGKFVFKRLVKNNKPQEKKIKEDEF